MDKDIVADRCYDLAVAPDLPMSEEQLKAFLEKVKADSSLQEKMKDASDADAVVAIAKDAGFSITTEDLNSDRQNLTDDELEGVAGSGTTATGCTRLFSCGCKVCGVW